MKRILNFLLLISITFSVLYAQTPNAFKYQAVIRNTEGALITNQNVAFEIFIRQGSPTGSIVFSETHSVMTNDYGLITFNIGEGTVATGSIEELDWGGDQYYIQISMDPEGGTAYEILGITKLLSVPYAQHATTSDSVRVSLTLDNAYDFGGSGQGSTITADAGAVTIAGPDGLIVEQDISSNNITATGDVIANNMEVAKTLSADTVKGLLKSPQLDYINAGSQTLVNEEIFDPLLAQDTVYLACAYNDYLLGTPLIPNPDTNEYKLFYYISGCGSNSDNVNVSITLNTIHLFTIKTWSDATYRQPKHSKFFYSWEQFPEMNAYSYPSIGLTISAYNPDPVTPVVLRIYDISINYVYIRNGVDYPKVDGLTGYPDE